MCYANEAYLCVMQMRLIVMLSKYWLMWVMVRSYYGLVVCLILMKCQIFETNKKLFSVRIFCYIIWSTSATTRLQHGCLIQYGCLIQHGCVIQQTIQHLRSFWARIWRIVVWRLKFQIRSLQQLYCACTDVAAATDFYEPHRHISSVVARLAQQVIQQSYSNIQLLKISN